MIITWGGDTAYSYRTAGSGDWNASGTWEYWNGSSWGNAALTVPSAANSVFVQRGHTVTLTGAEECRDFNVQIATTMGVAQLQSYALSVYGFLRGYDAAVGTVPGADQPILSKYPCTDCV